MCDIGLKYVMSPEVTLGKDFCGRTLCISNRQHVQTHSRAGANRDSVSDKPWHGCTWTQYCPRQSSTSIAPRSTGAGRPAERSWPPPSIPERPHGPPAATRSRRCTDTA